MLPNSRYVTKRSFNVLLNKNNQKKRNLLPLNVLLLLFRCLSAGVSYWKKHCIFSFADGPIGGCDSFDWTIVHWRIECIPTNLAGSRTHCQPDTKRIVKSFNTAIFLLSLRQFVPELAQTFRGRQAGKIHLNDCQSQLYLESLHHRSVLGGNIVDDWFSITLLVEIMLFLLSMTEQFKVNVYAIVQDSRIHPWSSLDIVHCGWFCWHDDDQSLHAAHRFRNTSA